MGLYDRNTLECRLKAAQKELEAFRSGEAYEKQKQLRLADLKRYRQQIALKDAELAQAHTDTVQVRKQWFAVFEDMEKEHEKALQKQAKQILQLQERLFKAEADRDTALDRVTEWKRKYYETATMLEEEKGKNLKLLAQLNRNYENSSLPSSHTPNHKIISNSREKTGKKPGGQPGHKGHGRKKQQADRIEVLPMPEQVCKDPRFQETGKEIIRQKIGIQVSLTVQEYHAPIYWNPETKEAVHAVFPEGVVNDVNYDGSIRAFLFLLNSHCNLSMDKCSRFLSDLTGGKLNISKGMISSLAKTFADKTEAEQKAILSETILSPVMHTDCTNMRVNGKSAYVFVCAAPNGEAIYYARKKKGHEGVKGTAAEDYQGILIHDHESTFYRYGSNHQECLAHVQRYLKNSMENEPDRTWNRQMRSLLQKMIHYRNSLNPGEEPDPDTVSALEQRYTEILQIAKKEYEDIPPNPYYPDGHNLFLRMDKFRKNHLLFLHDTRVPVTNNTAERLLRACKRKQAQVMSFRSLDSVDALCKSLTVLNQLRMQGTNLFDQVCEIFH